MEIEFLKIYFLEIVFFGFWKWEKSEKVSWNYYPFLKRIRNNSRHVSFMFEEEENGEGYFSSC